MKKGDFTAVELTQAYLDVIKAKNGEINAYLEVFEDALEQAKQADAQFKAGKATLLTGVPIAVKDNTLIQGKRAGSASKILEGYVAPYDATVIARLKKEGVVFLGRTNMDEFAMGASTETSAYGITKNPLDTSRVPGGSSGGSAAAVAMDGALVALASDTGGSIRQPASFCGLVGLKPTYGAVSRYGLMAMASSLDQIGPFGKTVADVEAVFDVIHGKDGKDGTTFEAGTSTSTYPKKRLGKNKPIIGVPRAFLKEGIEPGVLAAFDAALDSFKAKGYEIRDVELPNIGYSIATYYIIVPAEVSSNMARYDGMKYGLHKDGADVIGDYFETRGAGLGREVKRRILLGAYVLSSGYYDAYYNRANAVRAMITEDFLNAFDTVDMIVMPTTPAPAFKLGEKTNDPLAMYLEDIFTSPANLTGLPAMSVPCGVIEKDGVSLPVGLQLMARHGDEATLFEAGKEFLGE